VLFRSVSSHFANATAKNAHDIHVYGRVARVGCSGANADDND